MYPPGEPPSPLHKGALFTTPELKPNILNSTDSLNNTQRQKIAAVVSVPSGGDVDIGQGVEGSEAGHQVVEARERHQVHGDLIQVHVQRALKACRTGQESTSKEETMNG